MSAGVGVCGYVLAGGRSSRMGVDKAAIEIGGRSLLEIAVEQMRAVTESVAVVGERDELPEGVEAVRDRVAGCGPVGGMEAALRDCRERGAEFAAFLPVDTPLLPGGLLRALAERWRERPAMRAGVAVADGRTQPLVSLLHVELLGAFERALAEGNYKLQPLLWAATEAAATRVGAEPREVFLRSEIRWRDGSAEERRVLAEGQPLRFQPTEGEWARRARWFANLNTPEELELAVSAVAETGAEASTTVPIACTAGQSGASDERSGATRVEKEGRQDE